MNTAGLIFNAMVKGEPGATVPNREGLELPTTGYLVGGKVPSFILERGSMNLGSVRDMRAWIERQTSDYVGMWVAPSGNVYIDAVDWVVNLGYALGLARRRGELEIRDVAAGRNIPVDHARGETIFTAHP